MGTGTVQVTFCSLTHCSLTLIGKKLSLKPVYTFDYKLAEDVLIYVAISLNSQFLRLS